MTCRFKVFKSHTLLDDNMLKGVQFCGKKDIFYCPYKNIFQKMEFHKLKYGCLKIKVSGCRMAHA